MPKKALEELSSRVSSSRRNLLIRYCRKMDPFDRVTSLRSFSNLVFNLWEYKLMTQTAAQKTKAPLKPLGNRVLAQRLEEQQTVKGGIIIPETAKKKQEKALIIAIGTGKKDSKGTLIPCPVKVGDTILMDKYSAQEVTIEGEEYVILRSEDIIAIVK